MKALKSLNLIYPRWQDRVIHQVALSQPPQGHFEALLDQFYNRLCQAVDAGDSTQLDAVLDDWLKAMPESEPASRDLILLRLINQIQLTTYEVARESLETRDASTLIEALTPIFLHACDYSAQSQHERIITEISFDLEKPNQALERLEKSKSKFIAIAAHELKTPLTLIEGYTSMLREQFAGENTYLQLEVLLQGIDNGTRRLREIIDDMIDVSLIDNYLLALKFQPIRIGRMLKHIKDEFASTLEERQLALEIAPFAGADEMTFGDTERLYQAFRNIFLNAIKYTPDGGRIFIDGRLLPGFIEISVKDSGIGIALEDQRRIFEKFNSLVDISLHSSGKTKFKGSGPGLGLPITRGIIEAHGGSIWAESKGFDEVNCPGSTFHILLPIRKAPPDDRSARLFSAFYD